MIEFTTPIPDCPSDIDRSVTEGQAHELFKLFIENQNKITKSILDNISKEVDKDKYIV